MTTTTRHSDPTIDAFLADGGFADLDAWMEDSGYEQRDGGWCYPFDYADPSVAGLLVDPEGVIEGAIEASEFDPDEVDDDEPLSPADALFYPMLRD